MHKDEKVAILNIDNNFGVINKGNTIEKELLPLCAQERILNDIQPGVDFENETHLIDNHLLDSLSIISLVAELEDTFDITVPAVEIIPANFNSAEAMMEMIQRLQED